jgi:hypothetical protein
MKIKLNDDDPSLPEDPNTYPDTLFSVAPQKRR